MSAPTRSDLSQYVAFLRAWADEHEQLRNLNRHDLTLVLIGTAAQLIASIPQTVARDEEVVHMTVALRCAVDRVLDFQRS